MGCHRAWQLPKHKAEANTVKASQPLLPETMEKSMPVRFEAQQGPYGRMGHGVSCRLNAQPPAVTVANFHDGSSRPHPTSSTKMGCGASTMEYIEPTAPSHNNLELFHCAVPAP